MFCVVVYWNHIKRCDWVVLSLLFLHYSKLSGCIRLLFLKKELPADITSV